MKHSTAPVLEGCPSNIQSKAPKWSFRPTRKSVGFIGIATFHGAGFLLLHFPSGSAWAKPNVSALQSFYSLTLASTEILFETVSLEVYIGDFEGDKRLYRLVSEINCLYAYWSGSSSLRGFNSIVNWYEWQHNDNSAPSHSSECMGTVYIAI